MNNFDLKKYLAENKLTKESTQIKQTAIEWLVNQLPLGVKNTIMDKIEEAKALDFEDRSKFLRWVRDNYESYKTGWVDKETGNQHRLEDDLVDQYYNQIHGK